MKKTISAIILAIVLLSVSVMFSSCETKKGSIDQPKTWDWQSFEEVEQYNGFFDSKIIQVKLRDAVDSARWIVFEDADLIAKWEEFFTDLEVKAVEFYDTNSFVGGPPVATITTETSNYSFKFASFSEKQILIDDYLYEFRSSMELPFDETYDEGEQRHGVVTPWD